MEKELIFPRDIEASLLRWIERRETYAIKGPRQSGKTTLLRILEDDLKKKGINTVFLNFEDPDILEAFETNPKEYIRSFLTKEGKYCFLMDEYHYVKDPGKKLKLLYDTFENSKFIVTGSSSLELSGAMAKFLVGRVFFFELFPFNFHEFLTAKDPRLAKIYEEKNNMVKEFLSNKVEVEKDIFLKELAPFFDQYVIFGGYSAVIKAEDFDTKRAILKNIYDTYISKDVVEFLKVTDAFKYRHVVRALAVLIGNLINYNEICSACNTYYKELKRMISILSETYIINLIQPFYRNPLTELKKVPKLYFFDLGLRNYIIDNFNPLEKRTDSGALVENFVFLSLKNNFPEAIINYWRTIAKAEVDFVLKIKDEIIPIEVKYQSFKEPKVSKGLRSFIKSYKIKKAIVITKNFWSKIKINNTDILFIPACYL
ncbi:MAG: ATP-binding protein [archaeon]|nr:ATP-binding protein [archaeon]MCP8313203.1 ATP-binding protein [archaeon]MCP8316063.1 ATP-binding protein [archaeon]MCP8320907.1 ATP-binding protein [archaeon]